MQKKFDLVKSYERQLIFLLNLEGWRLYWTGEGYESYDAVGFDDKGNSCVLELKFRKKTYRLKILEKLKYDNLLSAKAEKKYYGVIDKKGLYIFDLEKITDTTQFIDCPSSTFFDEKEVKRQKEVFLLGNANKRYFFNFF